jgi:uncharacterized membrane protein affecting hemolysin expression
MHRFLLSLPFPHKAALSTALLSFIACGLLIIASHQSQRQLVQHSAEFFSQSLAQQLAMEARTALIQDDKLSLQTLLDQLVAESIISHAVIYSVDSKPLAEAGRPHKQLLAQSASISIENTLAGYVVISLNPYLINQQVKRNSWSLLGLSLLLGFAVYGISLVLIQPLAKFVQRHSAINPDPKSSVNKQSYTLLHLEMTELTESQDLEGAIQVVAEQLHTLCHLYDGEFQATRSNAFTASFANHGGDDDNHPFRGLCCAYLMQALHQHNSELQLAISLSLQEASVAKDFRYQQLLDQLAEHARQQPAVVNAEQAIYQHPSVLGRVENKQGTLTRFCEAYQQLLDKQLGTLLK